eukprot:TRINITY_DN14786_c0_g1_i1.p1 TRINITY_DN14786_c0_g1~~TRINITY_DN14786_c0_g1_i1.p1  ORF type:complete len:304 (-),score=37.68 TRINITY_DN14786_c0_g1_i1:84-995(-)
MMELYKPILEPVENWLRFYDPEAVLVGAVGAWAIPAIAISLYIAFVFGVPPLIQKPVECNRALKLWNLGLAVFSAVIFVFWAIAWGEVLLQYGLREVLCTTDRIYFYPGNMIGVCSFIFTMSKFVELGDTIFLVLRKKPVIFLHWYHHITVLAFCWFALVAQYPAGHVFGIMNAAVHSIMYWYYFLMASGARPRWGSYLTLVQLSQMVVGIVLTSTWAYYHLFTGGCSMMRVSGNWGIASSTVMYASYFLLFLQFYLNRDRSAPRASSTTTVSGATAHKYTKKTSATAQPVVSVSKISKLRAA